MPQFGGVATVHAPPSVAFEALANFRDIPKYVPSIVRARQLSDGRVTKGTLFEQVTVVFGREVPIRTEVTECEPNRLLAYRALDGPFKYHARYEFSDTPHGAQIRYDVDLPVAWYLWPASPLFGRMWARNYARNMEAFGRYAETFTPSGEGEVGQRAHASM